MIRYFKLLLALSCLSWPLTAMHNSFESDEQLARRLQQEEFFFVAGKCEKQIADDARLALQLQMQDEIAIAPSLFERRELLMLPGLTGGDLKLPGIYHVRSRAKVPEQEEWSCGFHALYNMGVLEHRVKGRRISDDEFFRVCASMAANPHKDSDDAEITAIARKLGLSDLHHLEYREGKIKPIFNTEIEYFVNSGESEAAVEARAIERLENKFWHNRLQEWAKAKTHFCMNFGAFIRSYSNRNNYDAKGEPHIVFVSAVKDARGAIAIYIFDNVNEDEPAISQEEIRDHVLHIYSKLIG